MAKPSETEIIAPHDRRERELAVRLLRSDVERLRLIAKVNSLVGNPDESAKLVAHTAIEAYWATRKAEIKSVIKETAREVERLSIKRGRRPAVNEDSPTEETPEEE